MMWWVKAIIDRNSRRNSRKIARELNISRERVLHILKNEIGLKPLKFQKVQELTDGQEKIDWKEPRSYYACTKVASYRIWFSPMRSHFKLSSLWTNKMIGYTCQIRYVSWKFIPAIGQQNSSGACGNGPP